LLKGKNHKTSNYNKARGLHKKRVRKQPGDEKVSISKKLGVWGGGVGGGFSGGVPPEQVRQVQEEGKF